MAGETVTRPVANEPLKSEAERQVTRRVEPPSARVPSFAKRPTKIALDSKWRRSWHETNAGVGETEGPGACGEFSSSSGGGAAGFCHPPAAIGSEQILHQHVAAKISCRTERRVPLRRRWPANHQPSSGHHELSHKRVASSHSKGEIAPSHGRRTVRSQAESRTESVPSCDAHQQVICAVLRWKAWHLARAGHGDSKA